MAHFYSGGCCRKDDCVPGSFTGRAMFSFIDCLGLCCGPASASHCFNKNKQSTPLVKLVDIIAITHHIPHLKSAKFRQPSEKLNLLRISRQSNARGNDSFENKFDNRIRLTQTRDYSKFEQVRGCGKTECRVNALQASLEQGSEPDKAVRGKVRSPLWS